MALVHADRVKETSTTTGTGSYALEGAVAGFRSFSAAVGNGNTCYYAATDGTDWEVGVGTFSAPSTLARTTVLASSNGGSAVNWGAVVKTIVCTIPATKFRGADELAALAFKETIDDAALVGDGVLTLAKLANMATQRLLGRSTTGSGAPEVLQLTTVLDWLSNSQGALLYRGASAWAALGAGGAGKMLLAGGASANPAWGSPAYLQFDYRQSSGTAGGTTTLGAYTKYPLNTEVLDTDSLGSISSSVITLAAGTYNVWGWVIFYRTNSSRLRLRNTSDSATLILGSSTRANTGNNVSTSALIQGRFTIAASKNIELQYYCESGSGESSALGFPVGSGESEVYGSISFERVG